MTTQDENQDTVQNSAYDPFPQPQTIPSGWDTSGFFATSRPDSTTDAIDAAEAGKQVDE